MNTVEPQKQMRKKARDAQGNRLPGGAVLNRAGHEWHPTENQMDALAYCQKRDYNYKITLMAKSLEMDDHTFRKWFDGPAFVSWWNEQTEKYMARQIPRIMSAMIDEATGKKKSGRSGAAAARLILDRYDKQFIPKSQTEINVKGRIDVEHSSKQFDQLCDEITRRHAALPASERPAETRILPRPGE